VTAFADPHAKFGLQFHVEFEERSGADEDADDDAGDPDDDDAIAVDQAKVSQRAKSSRAAAPLAAVKSGGPEADDAAGKIVTLDAFRKK
jgi:hypothetical protein